MFKQDLIYMLNVCEVHNWYLLLYFIHQKDKNG